MPPRSIWEDLIFQAVACQWLLQGSHPPLLPSEKSWPVPSLEALLLYLIRVPVLFLKWFSTLAPTAKENLKRAPLQCCGVKTILNTTIHISALKQSLYSTRKICHNFLFNHLRKSLQGMHKGEDQRLKLIFLLGWLKTSLIFNPVKTICFLQEVRC